MNGGIKMLPTEELKLEHQAVLSILEILNSISAKIRRGEPVDIQHLEQILKILKEFVDQSHHGKEEKILFTALEKLGFPKEGGPVGVMLVEHDNGRSYIQGMREAVASVKAGDQSALKDFAVNASYYSALMVEHIYKEDNILYPMADMHLSPDDKRTMLNDFRKIEKEAIGLDHLKVYLDQIEELKAIYNR
jgi:hemerythrin-like domain-containing protein